MRRASHSRQYPVTAFASMQRITRAALSPPIARFVCGQASSTLCGRLQRRWRRASQSLVYDGLRSLQTQKEIAERFQLRWPTRWISERKNAPHDRYVSAAARDGRRISTRRPRRTALAPPSMWGSPTMAARPHRSRAPILISSDETAATTYYERVCRNGHCSALDQAKRDRRRMLYWAMIGAGFAPYPAEYWHFELGTRRGSGLSQTARGKIRRGRAMAERAGGGMKLGPGDLVSSSRPRPNFVAPIVHCFRTPCLCSKDGICKWTFASTADIISTLRDRTRLEPNTSTRPWRRKKLRRSFAQGVVMVALGYCAIWTGVCVQLQNFLWLQRHHELAVGHQRNLASGDFSAWSPTLLRVNYLEIPMNAS